MPISGFKKGDKVITPAGRPGEILEIKKDGFALVECHEANGGTFRRVFRQAALRWADGRRI